MRRKKIFKLFLFFILIIIIVSVSYAYLSTTLKISGEVSGYYGDDYKIDKDSNPNLSINTPIVNMWQENNLYKYQYKFNIKNNGTENYDSYKIIVTYNSNISTVNTWNFDYIINSKVLTLTNKYVLNSGSYFEVNYIVTTNVANLKILKIKLEANTSTSEPNSDNIEIVFNKTNGWGNYTYQYDVTITNKTGVKITYWQINLILPIGTNFENGWNAIFNNGQTLIIKNETYNGTLENGQSTTFGLQLNTDVLNYIPNNYTVQTR